MRDHVEIGHLTKYDAFRVNRDQVMDLEIWFKIHTNVSNFETAPQKPDKLLNCFTSFVSTVNSRHAPIIWKKLRWKSLCFPIFKSIAEIIKILNMVLGDAVSKLEMLVWILNCISKFITWSLLTLTASYLVKWPILTWSFKTCPSFLLNFGMANSMLSQNKCEFIEKTIPLWNVCKVCENRETCNCRSSGIF